MPLKWVTCLNSSILLCNQVLSNLKLITSHKLIPHIRTTINGKTIPISKSVRVLLEMIMYWHLILSRMTPRNQLDNIWYQILLLCKVRLSLRIDKDFKLFSNNHKFSTKMDIKTEYLIQRYKTKWWSEMNKSIMHKLSMVRLVSTTHIT